jgi:mannose-6-phosphate isomerase-like protein (cupin superfamily)
MRPFITVLALVVSATVLSAQQPAAPSAAAMRSYLASADVKALIAKAKAERKSDQPILVQPLLQLTPYSLNLEYRVAAPLLGSAIHETEAELFYVVEGSGTLTTGGKLTDEKRTNPQNLTGTGIEGGTARQVAAGDVAIVPEGTPHWFSKVNGTLVVMSIHLPRGAR